jgi:hypothetical protein
MKQKADRVRKPGHKSFGIGDIVRRFIPVLDGQARDNLGKSLKLQGVWKGRIKMGIKTVLWIFQNSRHVPLNVLSISDTCWIGFGATLGIKMGINSVLLQ